MDALNRMESRAKFRAWEQPIQVPWQKLQARNPNRGWDDDFCSIHVIWLRLDTVSVGH
jgi:hypothetical protein